MLIRAYCEYDHERMELIPLRDSQTSACSACGNIVTREALYRSLPPLYQNIVNTDLGGALASFADIGAIDLIFYGKYPLDVEYARERDLKND